MKELKDSIEFSFDITIKVSGVLRAWQYEDGLKCASAQYNAETVKQEISDQVIPKLEKIIGFKTFRKNGKSAAGGYELIGFPMDLRSKDY